MGNTVVIEGLAKLKEHLAVINELVEQQEKKYTKTRGVKLRKALDALCNEKTEIKRALIRYEESITKKRVKK